MSKLILFSTMSFRWSFQKLSSGWLSRSTMLNALRNSAKKWRSSSVGILAILWLMYDSLALSSITPCLGDMPIAYQYFWIRLVATLSIVPIRALSSREASSYLPILYSSALAFSLNSFAALTVKVVKITCSGSTSLFAIKLASLVVSV